MTTRKQWLFDNGHIDKMGKGRLSLANQALCEAAAKAGTVFSDMSVKSDSTVVKATYAAEKTVPDIPDARYPVDTSRVYLLDGTLTKATTRAACQCGVSLAYCTCSAPCAIVSNDSGYVRVRMEA